MGHNQIPQCVELLVTFSLEVMHVEVCVSVAPHSVAHILFVETTALGQARSIPEQADMKV